MPDDEILNNETPTQDDPPAWGILDDVKLALRLTTDAYNEQLNLLIAAAGFDLGISGLPEGEYDDDPLVKQAIITYCIAHFGSPSDYDKLKASYDEQKAQLQMATGYTDWGDGS